MTESTGKDSEIRLGKRPTVPPSHKPSMGTHCWISAPVGGPGPRAALLIEWRRNEASGAFQGLVVYVSALRGSNGAAVVTEWVTASMLTPRN